MCNPYSKPPRSQCGCEKLHAAARVYRVTLMSKERLLVARATEIQLQTAAQLLRQAVQNLSALKHGVQPGLDAAKKALAECEKSSALTTSMIERIPE
jgi:hypothetical protein